ncbi:carbohydrate-binding protein [Nesterenkonia muleiensis]|uniref:carbohydrate-binding protein n=1 Tax=Nesterenkonia muleiensis TaxID=2282648 RepID=UPI0013005BD0|nr:carbohydrate-binding protein [Nesterenkonia muleiensis]
MSSTNRSLTALLLAAALLAAGFTPAAYADEQPDRELSDAVTEEVTQEAPSEDPANVDPPHSVLRLQTGGGPTRVLEGETFYVNARLYVADSEGIHDLPMPDGRVEVYASTDADRENLLGSSDDWFIEESAGTPHFRIANFDLDVALPIGQYHLDLVFTGTELYEEAEGRTGQWTVLGPEDMNYEIQEVSVDAPSTIEEGEPLELSAEVTGNHPVNNLGTLDAYVYYADDQTLTTPLTEAVRLNRGNPYTGALTVEYLEPGEHTLMVHVRPPFQAVVWPANSQSFTVTVLPAEPEHEIWDAGTAYTGGETVEHEGRLFEALWWTQNQEPGASPWSAWSEIGAPTECEAGTYPAWAASTEFTGGETVVHGGTVYTAQWYSRNQEPGDPWGPWAESGDC